MNSSSDCWCTDRSIKSRNYVLCSLYLTVNGVEPWKWHSHYSCTLINECLSFCSNLITLSSQKQLEIRPHYRRPHAHVNFFYQIICQILSHLKSFKLWLTLSSTVVVYWANVLAWWLHLFWKKSSLGEWMHQCTHF